MQVTVTDTATNEKVATSEPITTGLIAPKAVNATIYPLDLVKLTGQVVPAFADGTPIATVAALVMPENNPFVGKAVQCDRNLILTLPEGELGNEFAEHLALKATQTSGKTSVYGSVGSFATWEVTADDLFKLRYEEWPFTEVISPDTPVTIEKTSNEDDPLIYRVRETGEVRFKVRQSRAKRDEKAMRQQIADAWNEKQIEKERFRYENAWELMEMLVDEDLFRESDEPSDWMEILRDEVGDEAYNSMVEAARIIAPLFPRFLKPVDGWAGPKLLQD